MENASQKIQEIIQDILNRMSIQASVELEQNAAGDLVYNIHTHETQLVIGRQGSHLHALQVLVQQFAVKSLGYGNVPRFTIDVDDYRRKREWYIKEMARSTAETVKRTGRPVTLEPMPNYERRLIHSYIQEHHSDMITESIGEGSSRRIIVRIK